MPKLKTKKTLLKRIKITHSGKLLKKQSRTGHLKVKWDSSRKSRKRKTLLQKNKGHKKMFRKLLARASKGII